MTDVPSSDHQRYRQLMAQLFDRAPHQRVDRLFEFVCCLVRAGGMEDQGWDPIEESTALVDDLAGLSAQELSSERFSHPARTRARLALLAYCHVVEASFFYHLLANLLRLRGGSSYSVDPFHDLNAPSKKGKKSRPPTPSQKIARITELGKAVDIEVGSAFDEVYFKDIRNAVFHADYTLTDSQFRMLGGRHKAREGHLTPAVPFDELNTLIRRSFDFYGAIIEQHRRARRMFGELKGKLIPYDQQYKGLLELLFEDDLLCGFRVYWPNGGHSEFARTREGCTGLNITFAEDLSIGLMVGLYASRPGSFSPLVEEGAAPVYKPAAGRTKVPNWPEPLQIVDAEE